VCGRKEASGPNPHPPYPPPSSSFIEKQKSTISHQRVCSARTQGESPQGLQCKNSGIGSLTKGIGSLTKGIGSLRVSHHRVCVQELRDWQSHQRVCSARTGHGMTTHCDLRSADYRCTIQSSLETRVATCDTHARHRMQLAHGSTSSQTKSTYALCEARKPTWECSGPEHSSGIAATSLPTLAAFAAASLQTLANP
jgi:hypothetical protein